MAVGAILKLGVEALVKQKKVAGAGSGNFRTALKKGKQYKFNEPLPLKKQKQYKKLSAEYTELKQKMETYGRKSQYAAQRGAARSRMQELDRQMTNLNVKD